jgi:hypothetical protein
MRRFLKWQILAALAAVFVLMQLVPYRVDNPKANDEPKWDSPRTRELAVRACYDCHSNRTHLLWFEHVAPVKWYVANHVTEGRQALNFSEWGTNAGRGAHDADEVVGDSMPPAYYHYLGLHSDTKLSDKETKQLIDGLRKTIAADPPSGGGGEGGGERDVDLGGNRGSGDGD